MLFQFSADNASLHCLSPGQMAPADQFKKPLLYCVGKPSSYFPLCCRVATRWLFSALFSVVKFITLTTSLNIHKYFVNIIFINTGNKETNTGNSLLLLSTHSNVHTNNQVETVLQPIVHICLWRGTKSSSGRGGVSNTPCGHLWVSNSWGQSQSSTLFSSAKCNF